MLGSETGWDAAGETDPFDPSVLESRGWSSSRETLGVRGVRLAHPEFTATLLKIIPGSVWGTKN